MDKEFRSKKHCKNKKPNRHCGQHVKHRHGSSKNAINALRKQKSKYRRKVWKGFIKKTRKRYEMECFQHSPSIVYGLYESGWVEGFCNCQGWDYENDSYVCPYSILMDIKNTLPNATSIKLSRKDYDYWGEFEKGAKLTIQRPKLSKIENPTAIRWNSRKSRSKYSSTA